MKARAQLIFADEHLRKLAEGHTVPDRHGKASDERGKCRFEHWSLDHHAAEWVWTIQHYDLSPRCLCGAQHVQKR